MSLLEETVFREWRPSDYNFVLSSWAKSFRGSPWAGVVPNNEWHSLVKGTLDQLVLRGALVVCLVSKHDSDQILGWICYEKSLSGVAVCHYCYVKDDFRSKGHGLGTALLNLLGEGQFVYTCRTPDFDAFLRKVPQTGKHVPAVARRKDLEPIYAE